MNREKREIKIGDEVFVRVFNKRPMHWNESGRMDHLMGKILKVTNRNNFGHIAVYDEVVKHSWWLTDYDVNLINEDQPAIEIYKKGNKIIATNCVTGKKAIAKCHPDDKFSFSKGVEIAVERLIGNSKDYYDASDGYKILMEAINICKENYPNLNYDMTLGVVIISKCLEHDNPCSLISKVMFHAIRMDLPETQTLLADYLNMNS